MWTQLGLSILRLGGFGGAPQSPPVITYVPTYYIIGF